MYTLTMLFALGPLTSTQVLTSALTVILTAWGLVLGVAGFAVTLWWIARSLRPSRIRESWNRKPRSISEFSLGILGNSASVKLAEEVQKRTAVTLEDLSELVLSLQERLSTVERLMHAAVGENGGDDE